MKKLAGWGLGLLIAGGILLIAVGPTSADKFKGFGFNKKQVGSPQDSLSDELPDHPGADRNNDRTPDSVPDQNNDSTPDCGNGPGDGNCSNGVFSRTGSNRDGFTDYNGPGDGNSDGRNDIDTFIKTNRPHDEASDHTADALNSDRYLLTNGKDGSVGDSTPDRTVFDGCPDAVGGLTGHRSNSDCVQDSTIDRSAADIAAEFDDPGRPGRDGDSRGSQGDGAPSRDYTLRPHDRSVDLADLPDGKQDRNAQGNLRDRGSYNRSQASREVKANSGPGEHIRDNAADRGGLSTGGTGGGGGGGCSMVAGQAATPASGIAYLLVLLTPAALVLVRRRMRK